MGETMAWMNRTPPRGDRPPWDPVNGLRVGIVIGALLGAAAVAVTGISSVWIVAVCAVIGGGLGYRWERRKREDR